MSTEATWMCIDASCESLAGAALRMLATVPGHAASQSFQAEINGRPGGASAKTTRSVCLGGFADGMFG
jgi:hypothetical protein